MSNSFFVLFTRAPWRTSNEFKSNLEKEYTTGLVIEPGSGSGEGIYCLEWSVEPIETGIWRAALSSDLCTVVFDGTAEASLALVIWLASQAQHGASPYLFDSSYSFGFVVDPDMTAKMIEADCIAERHEPLLQ